MNNYLICSNCNAQNPLYANNCKSCNSFLRSKIPNIDLWDSIWNIFISPIDTAVKIIQADKKNFLGSLLFIWLIKSAVNNFIMRSYVNIDGESIISFSRSLLEGGAFSVIAILLFSLVITFIFSILKIETRFKDNVTIYTFALIPLLLGFIFLTPFHFALYGLYWYTVNPSPIIIKPLVSYALYGIEGLLMIWTLVLFVAVTYAQSKKPILSVVAGVLLFVFLYGFQFLFI